MARFKRRTARRASFGRKARTRHSSRSGGLNPLNLIIAGGAYGALRNTLSGIIAPVTNMLPLGQYSDEAIFGALGYFLAKKQKGMLKSLGYSMLSVEAAAVGSNLSSGIGTNTTDSNSGMSGWI
jgi:hypothetical protein